MSDTESDLDVDDELTETTSKFKSPNANKAGQANTETGLTTVSGVLIRLENFN